MSQKIISQHKQRNIDQVDNKSGLQIIIKRHHIRINDVDENPKRCMF